MTDGNKKYKTLDDIRFEKDENNPSGRVAHGTLEFSNGYGVSVTEWGPQSHDYGRGRYEVMLLKKGEPCYDTELTSDVMYFDKLDKLNSTLQDAQDLDENGTIKRDDRQAMYAGIADSLRAKISPQPQSKPQSPTLKKTNVWNNKGGLDR